MTWQNVATNSNRKCSFETPVPLRMLARALVHHQPAALRSETAAREPAARSFSQI